MNGRCPTCDSPSPLKHPAMQADGGEVQPCPNVWHLFGPLTEEQHANNIRNQLRWHVPSQLPAFDALWAGYERLTAECIALKQIINASETDRGRLRSDLNQAAAVVEAACAYVDEHPDLLAFLASAENLDPSNEVRLRLKQAVDAFRSASEGNTSS